MENYYKNSFCKNSFCSDTVYVKICIIKVIEKKGIVTDDEKLHEVEVIIYATGFYGSEFLSSLQVEGRDGISLKEVWKDEPEAYLGVTIPNFPNLFCL